MTTAPANHPLIGTWVTEHEDSDAAFVISVADGVFQVSGFSRSDALPFEISDVVWNGESLSFVARFPPTNTVTRNTFRARSPGVADLALTVYDVWVKREVKPGEPPPAWRASLSSENRPMNRDELKAVRLLAEILVGDRRVAMESAKKLIASKAFFVSGFRAEILSRRKNKLSARLAAAYVLGFSGNKRSVAPLVDVVTDESEPKILRSHAAEALGNLGSAKALGPLAAVLKTSQPASVKIWSVYAISEIGGQRAYKALKEFAQQKPTGKVRLELKEALARFQRKT